MCVIRFALWSHFCWPLSIKGLPAFISLKALLVVLANLLLFPFRNIGAPQMKIIPSLNSNKKHKGCISSFLLNQLLVYFQQDKMAIWKKPKSGNIVAFCKKKLFTVAAEIIKLLISACYIGVQYTNRFFEKRGKSIGQKS